MNTSRLTVTRRALLGRTVLAAAGALLAACTAPPAPGTTSSSMPASASAGGATFGTAVQGHVVFGAANEPGGLNPLLPDTGSSAASWELLYEGLVTPDPRTGAPSPSLAHGWDASPDGLTWTFHLRPDVKWSDGQDFT